MFKFRLRTHQHEYRWPLPQFHGFYDTPEEVIELSVVDAVVGWKTVRVECVITVGTIVLK